MNRIEKQIAFIKEIDKLKEVYRRSYLFSQSRNENSAEHCWHVSMMAVILSEHANLNVNLSRVVEMLLVHDIVEIDAGDTFCYDEGGNLDKNKREQEAANRIFSILPDDQSDRLMKLWREYENADTPEAKFAIALDRLMPLLHNLGTSGKSWRENGITKNQVLERNEKIDNGSHALWEYAKQNILKAVENGILKDDAEPGSSHCPEGAGFF
jgi:putative hydrolases of HD superfamily